MKPFLLDVNVLVAFLWRAHVHHDAAHNWFAANRSAGFVTCPLTQAGAIRILGNPRHSAHWVTVAIAVKMLEGMLALPEHSFWPIDLPVQSAIKDAGLISGHQQITDAYLLALAKARGGILATFDRGVLALAGAPESVALIS